MNDNFRAGIALSLSLLLSTVVGSTVFLKAKKLSETVQVTGSAKKRIKSDLIIWNTSVTVEGAVLPEVYSRLNKNVELARTFLVSKGIPVDQITPSAVQTTVIRKSHRPNSAEDADLTPIVGYQLKQSLGIRSGDVDKVSAVAQQVTELVNQGILLESDAPRFLYTKLADTKVAILGSAGQDALARAKQIAAATGSSVGEIRSAETGVLQITPADSTDISEEGLNDTTSREKDITAVVHMTFALN